MAVQLKRIGPRWCLELSARETQGDLAERQQEGTDERPDTPPPLVAPRDHCEKLSTRVLPCSARTHLFTCHDAPQSTALLGCAIAVGAVTARALHRLQRTAFESPKLYRLLHVIAL